MMKVICILFAGGQGKRLRPLTYAIPKPLLPAIPSYRLIDIAIERCLAIARLFEVSLFVATAHNQRRIENHLAKHYNMITLLQDPKPFDTLGSLWQHQRQLVECEADILLALPTDYLLQIDFTNAVRLLSVVGNEGVLFCSRSQSDKHYVKANAEGIALKIERGNRAHGDLAYKGILAVRVSALRELLPSQVTSPTGLIDLVRSLVLRGRTRVLEFPAESITDMGTWPRYITHLIKAYAATTEYSDHKSQLPAGYWGR